MTRRRSPRATTAVVGWSLNATALLSRRLAGAGAFALFARPRGRSAVRPAECAAMAQARTERLAVGGAEVVSYRWGDGDRPVVLVHGWESRASRFSALVAALAARGRAVLAFDAPAHGDSSGDLATIVDYGDVLRELQERHGAFGAVVGHSFGALAAFVAAREGVRTPALVGIASVSRLEHVITGFRTQLRLRSRLEPELRRRVERTLFPQEPDVWRRFAAPHAPAELPVPRILLVHDEHDDLTGPEQAYEIHRAYADRAELMVTAGLGHRRILADPEVVDRVAGFVAASDGPGLAA